MAALGQAVEAVGAIDFAVGDGVGLQYCPHENARSAAPDAGFDVVAGNILIDCGLDEFAKVLQSRRAHHGVGVKRPGDYAVFVSEIRMANALAKIGETPLSLVFLK